MTEKRFELQINGNGQADIIDWVESKEKNAICIYNDLGVLPYSSAKALCDLLNQLYDENKQLKQQINDFKLHYTENYKEFNKDELYVKDTNTEIELKNGNMVITVFVPQNNQYHKFNYYVTGRRLMRRILND